MFEQKVYITLASIDICKQHLSSKVSKLNKQLKMFVKLYVTCRIGQNVSEWDVEDMVKIDSERLKYTKYKKSP